MTAQVEQVITRHDVDQAWDDSVAAADWYERCALFKGKGGVTDDFVEKAREQMIQATDYAEQLQAQYDERHGAK